MSKTIELSDNSIAYLRLWTKVLHQNCKGKSRCVCHNGAYDLTVRRLDAIKRGMPDLEPGLESEIWSRAFEIHASSCTKNYKGSITPTWSQEKSKDICDCFELAYKEYNESIELWPIERDIIINTEDYLLSERVV